MNYELEIEKNLLDLGVSLEHNPLYEWIDNGIATRPELLAIKIYLHRASTSQPTISKQLIIDTLLHKESSGRRSELTNVQDAIQYDSLTPDGFEELARFISRDNYDTMYPIILRHMIWTIKRRMARLPDYCPLFVSVYGGAGSGKSEFLKAMFSVLPAAVKSRVGNAADLFNDDRQLFRFMDNYVIIMDELTGVAKTDLNKLKNQIDAEKVVYRMLGFNKTAEGRNNAQLVGTSNTRLRNTIMADTDIRKWAEIDFWAYPNNEVPEKMVTPLQKWNWLSLWKSVDESKQSPFHDSSTYNKFVAWTKTKCQHESSHMLYIQQLLDNKAGQWLSKRQIYDEGYLMEVKDHQLNWGNFKEKCEKVGIVAHKRESGIGLLIPTKINPIIKDEETL